MRSGLVSWANRMKKEIIIMAHNYTSPHALCPFYREETSRAISCEGPFPRTALRVSFRGSTRKVREEHCCKDWQSCPIAKMLWEANDAGPMI